PQCITGRARPISSPIEPIGAVSCRKCDRAPPSVLRLPTGFEPWHHGARVRPHLLGELALRPPAVSVERRSAGLVLEDPRAGKRAILDLSEDLPHLLANRRTDHARAADIVTEFGGVADAVAHVAHPALVHQVDDQ